MIILYVQRTTKAVKEATNINCFKMEGRQVFGKRYIMLGRNAKSWQECAVNAYIQFTIGFTAKSQCSFIFPSSFPR